MLPQSSGYQPILIVDDEPGILASFEIALQSGGIDAIMTCPDGREVLNLIRRQQVAAILLDINMPYLNGEQLLTQLSSTFPEIPVVMITGLNDVEMAVNCMKQGAFDYLVKPVEKSRLITSVKRALEFRTLRAENQMLKERLLSDQIANPEAFAAIITRDKAMLALFQYAESIAPSPEPVLITGETGVGKELMATAIHALSHRSGPLISVNVAGLDDNIFADTLFGHLKGAFTGANKARKGMVEQAAGGTLFLDEIGDLGLNAQVKLLRLLQEREYHPLGADLPKLAEIRVLVATNRDLGVRQAAGQFRKDLFYRLQAHHLHMPPLRERTGDLPLLTAHFITRAAGNLRKKPPTYPPELITLLENYHFPGNVRELKSMLQDAVSRHKSKMLSLKTFKLRTDPQLAATPAPQGAFGSKNCSWFNEQGTLPSLAEANRFLILEAMQRAQNNKSMAARLLNIPRQRLIRQLQKIGA